MVIDGIRVEVSRAMDVPEVKKLCEQLREVVVAGPGRNELALAEAKGIVSVLQDGVHWNGPSDKLVTINNWLTVWFSQRQWREYGESGEICMQSLLNDITVVEQYWDRPNAHV
jgi:endo-1,4-beta-D-glucanase Y